MLESKFCYYKDNKWGSIPAVKFPEAGRLQCASFDLIYSDGKLTLCVGANRGLYTFKDNVWSKFGVGSGLPDSCIYTITSFKNKLYICTSKGISVFDGRSFDNSIRKLLPKSKRNVIAVSFEKRNDGKEILWMLGVNWMGFIENGRFSLFSDKFDLHSTAPGECILFSASDKDRIFFGNAFAKFLMHKESKKIVPLLQKNGFSSNNAMSVFIDREGNVWFADSRGIDKLNNFVFNNYYESTGLQSNEVTAFLEYSPGKYLFGHNNGLTFLDNREQRRIDFTGFGSGFYSHQRVLDIMKDRAGNIWLASSELGLGKLEEDGQITWFRVAKNDLITSVCQDKAGKIWAFGFNNLYFFTGKSLRRVKLAQNNSPGFRKAFKFDDGNIYIAAATGLYKLKNRTAVNLLNNVNSALPMAKSLFAVLKVRQNEFLVGAEDGLYKFGNGSLTKFTMPGFRNNNSVYAILEDKKKNIFVGTGDGFYKLSKNGNVKYYTFANGLAGREINRSAFSFDSFDNLWIGTDKGISCFTEDNENRDIPEPVVNLKSIELIDGAVLPLDSNIVLNNSQNTFFVRFCAMSFIDEKNLEYKVKLEGFDKDWMVVSQSQIASLRYTNLPYGVYRLGVMSKNRSGNWSQPVYSGFITIDKPFYYKFWFVLLSFIAELLLLLGIYKIIVLRVNNTNLEKLVDQKTAKLRESEQNLRLINDELEKRVEERTDELARLNGQLKQYAEEQKQLNLYKDKFFSIVAHDLKSPFQGLLGVTSILEEEYDELTVEQVKHFVKVLRNSTKNVYSLIENLLQWSRLQTGKVPFEQENLNLYEQVIYVKNLLHPNLSGKNIALSVDVPEDLNLYADKKMLHSVLQNLGSNAIKFTKEGGRISVLAEKMDNFAQITISDTGVGIEKEDLAKLFRIDIQFSARGTNDEEGTGLGLTICKEMIERHGGNIRAESEPGKGSSFIFTLPLSI